MAILVTVSFGSYQYVLLIWFTLVHISMIYYCDHIDLPLPPLLEEECLPQKTCKLYKNKLSCKIKKLLQLSAQKLL